MDLCNFKFITEDAIIRRRYWIDEIVKLSGHFVNDSSRVENEIIDEVKKSVVYRFKKGEKIEVYPLHIYDTPYEERENPEYGDGQLRRVDGDRLFPKWGWAAEKVNTIR